MARGVSEAGSIALHAAAYLAAESGRLVPASEMARALGVSGAHLFKVLERLVKAGIARSARGPRGGYALHGRPADTSLKDVLEAIEGPIRPGDCLFGRTACPVKRCLMGDTLRRINSVMIGYLEGTSLSSVAAKMGRSAGG